MLLLARRLLRGRCGGGCRAAGRGIRLSVQPAERAHVRGRRGRIRRGHAVRLSGRRVRDFRPVLRGERGARAARPALCLVQGSCVPELPAGDGIHHDGFRRDRVRGVRRQLHEGDWLRDGRSGPQGALRGCHGRDRGEGRRAAEHSLRLRRGSGGGAEGRGRAG